MRSATPDSDIAASTCGEADPGGRIANVTTAPTTIGNRRKDKRRARGEHATSVRGRPRPHS